MAITTLDGIIANVLPPEEILKVGAAMVAGRPYSPWYVAGRPGAGAAPGASLNGSQLSATLSGQLPFPGTVGGKNIHLARMAAAANAPGVLWVCDRLWHDGGFVMTQTTAHTISAHPGILRDADGSTPGRGVMVGLEVSATVGNADPTVTLAYTNSAGTASRVATVGSEWGGSKALAGVGSFFPFKLDAGDLGVRSVQSLTFSVSWVSGTVHLVMYRPIARVEVPLANVGYAIDAITAGFPRMYDGSVPFFIWMPTSSVAVNFQAQLVYAQG